MICPKCGTTIVENGRFVTCPKCGAMFDSNDVPTNIKSNPTNKKSNPSRNPSFSSKVPDENKYVRQNPHNPRVPMSYDKKTFKKPAEYKNLFLYFILMIVTCGLYFLYQIYRLTKLSNEDNSMTKRSPGLQLFLSLLLPYVYWIYWAFQTGKRIENILKERTGKTASVASPSLILSFFGLDVIAMLVMQDKVNKYVGGITGTNMDADGFAKCKECGIYFPNDVSECPNCGKPYVKKFYENIYVKAAIIAVIALLFISLISSFASSCANRKINDTINDTINHLDIFNTSNEDSNYSYYDSNSSNEDDENYDDTNTISSESSSLPPYTGEYFTVTVGYGHHLNLRSSPSESSSILNQIDNGTRLKITKVRDNWGQTNYGGEEGWVCLRKNGSTYCTKNKNDSIYKTENGWYKYTDGKITYDENGVFQNKLGWWYVRNSKVDFNFTGVAENIYGTWYVKNGKVDFDCTDMIEYNGETYYVMKGYASTLPPG